MTLVDVGLRDGFQSIGPFVPTNTKIAMLRGLYEAGIRRLEATSFVSSSALPQFADAAQMVRAAHALSGLNAQVLVPTSKYAQRALDSGARHLAFVMSISEAHNQSNVRRSPAESASEYESIVQMAPAGTALRLNIATAFDCPYQGPVAETRTLEALATLAPLASHAEIALCDTTGRVTPDRVSSLFTAALRLFPGIAWAFHAHDTFGLGAANALAAWKAGVRVFDASMAGMGGCPFAPGATGNVATEDLVWMFEGMGVTTGIDMARLITVARAAADLPGAQPGGRVRIAMNPVASPA